MVWFHLSFASPALFALVRSAEVFLTVRPSSCASDASFRVVRLNCSYCLPPRANRTSEAPTFRTQGYCYRGGRLLPFGSDRDGLDRPKRRCKFMFAARNEAKEGSWTADWTMQRREWTCAKIRVVRCIVRKRHCQRQLCACMPWCRPPRGDIQRVGEAISGNASAMVYRSHFSEMPMQFAMSDTVCKRTRDQKSLIEKSGISENGEMVRR